MKRAEKALDQVQLFIVVTIIAGAISFILPVEKRQRIFNRGEQKTVLSKYKLNCDEISSIIDEFGNFSSKEKKGFKNRCLRAQRS